MKTYLVLNDRWIEITNYNKYVMLRRYVSAVHNNENPKLIRV